MSEQNMAATNNKIRQFVLEKFPAFHQKGLQDRDSIIESGIVDSMGMLEIVAFIETEFGVGVEDTDLTPENFQSISALSKFIKTKREPMSKN